MYLMIDRLYRRAVGHIVTETNWHIDYSTVEYRAPMIKVGGRIHLHMHTYSDMYLRIHHAGLRHGYAERGKAVSHRIVGFFFVDDQADVSSRRGDAEQVGRKHGSGAFIAVVAWLLLLFFQPVGALDECMLEKVGGGTSRPGRRRC